MVEAATQTRPPTFMRYQRVEQVLEQEPRFKVQMASKTEAVLKPNGDKQLFAPVVIQVTEAIHAEGQDAHKAQKMDIIRAAMEFFRPSRPQPDGAEKNEAPAAVIQREVAPPVPPAAAPVVATKPKPKPTPRAIAAPAKKPTTPKPAPAKKPVAAAPAAKSPPAAAPAPATNGQPVAQPTAEPVQRDAAPASPPPVRAVDGEEARAAEGRRNSSADAAYNPYISIYSLMLTALQLAENFDNQPGKEKRIEGMDKLAVEYRKFTGVKNA